MKFPQITKTVVEGIYILRIFAILEGVRDRRGVGCYQIKDIRNIATYWMHIYDK